MVRLWDLAQGICVGAFHAHTSDLVALAFSLDDNLLCSVGYDGRRRLQVRGLGACDLEGLIHHDWLLQGFLVAFVGYRSKYGM